MKNALSIIIVATWAINLSAQQTIGLFLNDEASHQGYTLFNPTASKTTYLIDNCGKEVHSWESDHLPGISVYLMPSGDLLRTKKIQTNIFNGGGSGGGIEIRDWEGDVKWEYDFSNDSTHQHHDIELLPNGNLLILLWELKTPQQAAEVGILNVNRNIGVWSEKIIEVLPLGSQDIEVIWEWSVWEHLIQDVTPSFPHYGSIQDFPHRLDANFAELASGDWLHFNSIDYNPILDQIMVSSRKLHELWIIDHSTNTEEAATGSGGNSGMGGDILYRYGNPLIYNRGETLDQNLFGPHDAHWIPQGFPNAGRIMIFNNGGARPDGNYSSIDIIEAPLHTNGINYVIEPTEAFGPEELYWTYTAEVKNQFFSFNLSGVQQLSNGNILICEGNSGHFFELTPSREVVWDYINPVGSVVFSQYDQPTNNAVFRIERFSPEYSAFGKRILEAGDPVELDPITDNCSIISSNAEIAVDLIKVMPNPFMNELVLDNFSHSTWQLELTDFTGNTIFKRVVDLPKIHVDISTLAKGVYLLRASQGQDMILKKLIKI